MQMTGAQVVCEALLREGVEVMFGHPGGAALPFYDALYHYPQIRHVLMRHEQAAAHAAEGYARATGRIGVCVATSGPGATNLMTGLAAAKMDSTPMLAITGQVARPFLGTEAFQECDTVTMAGPVVKKAFIIMDTKDIPQIVAEACRLALSGRPGPVLIDFPKDAQAEMMDYTPSAVAASPRNSVSHQIEGDVGAASRLLNEAQRPVIIAGHGVHLAAAWDELKALAEGANVPVINTLHGTGAFPRHHPLSLGMVGMHGMYWSNIAVDEADLVVGIGMRFDDRVIGRPGSFAPNAKIVHIEIDPSQVNKNVKTDVPLLGNAKDVLQALIPLVERQHRLEWFARVAELQHKHPSLEVPESGALMPQYVLSRINRLIQASDDPIVVTGVGQHQMWSGQYFFLDNPNSFISSGGLGVMGFEVPAAIGAQVGRPNADVWSICGDGGFQMTLQELATVVQEHLPIKYVIINNGYLGMVRQWQELFYEHRYKSVPISSPDFVKRADAYGIPAATVTTALDVDTALTKAASSKGPYLLNFLVSQEENVYPMVAPGASLADTIEDPRVAHRRQVMHLAHEGTVSYP
jgi:acetolactate synthase-1/2/3 large subunit